MTSQKFSALGRPMVLSDKTNVAIILITLLTLCLTFLYLILLGVYNWSEAVLPTFGATFSVFFAWAIAREINPDFSYSAFFGVTILILLIIYNENIIHPHYILLVWILFFQRILNRSVGYKAKLFDTALIMGLSIWLAFTYSWIIGLLAAFAFWLDASLKDPHPQHRLIALFALLISIVAFILAPTFVPHIFVRFELIVLVVVSVLFLSFIFMTKEVNSKADLTPNILNKQRLRFAQAFSLFSLVLLSVVNGIDAFYGLAALWCAMAGVFIHMLFVKSGKKTVYVEGDHETQVK